MLPDFKTAILEKNEDIAKKLVNLFNEYQVKATEAVKSLDAAKSGKKYEPSEDIKLYNQNKNPDSKENLLNDSTIKNLLNQI